MHKVLFAVLGAAFFVSACSMVTEQLDGSTGTTKAQRCVDYQGALTAAVALQEVKPSEARAERIKLYRAFLEVNCGG